MIMSGINNYYFRQTRIGVGCARWPMQKGQGRLPLAVGLLGEPFG